MLSPERSLHNLRKQSIENKELILTKTLVTRKLSYLKFIKHQSITQDHWSTCQLINEIASV